LGSFTIFWLSQETSTHRTCSILCPSSLSTVFPAAYKKSFISLQESLHRTLGNCLRYSSQTSSLLRYLQQNGVMWNHNGSVGTGRVATANIAYTLYTIFKRGSDDRFVAMYLVEEPVVQVWPLYKVRNKCHYLIPADRDIAVWRVDYLQPTVSWRYYDYNSPHYLPSERSISQPETYSRLFSYQNITNVQSKISLCWRLSIVCFIYMVKIFKRFNCWLYSAANVGITSQSLRTTDDGCILLRNSSLAWDSVGLYAILWHLHFLFDLVFVWFYCCSWSETFSDSANSFVFSGFMIIPQGLWFPVYWGSVPDSCWELCFTSGCVVLTVVPPFFRLSPSVYTAAALFSKHLTTPCFLLYGWLRVLCNYHSVSVGFLSALVCS